MTPRPPRSTLFPYTTLFRSTKQGLAFHLETKVTGVEMRAGKPVLKAQDKDGKAVEFAGDKVLGLEDRKSTRLNSSHMSISYAVFCLKKKKHVTDRCACSATS